MEKLNLVMLFHDVISILVMSTHCLNVVNKVINCNIEFGLILIFDMVKKSLE